MFFIRIDEWGWDDAPPRIPCSPVTCPASTARCPRPSTTCCALPRLTGGCWCAVEMLLRTGLRVSEYTSLPADAVVLIGAGSWLHVPVGRQYSRRAHRFSVKHC